MVGTAAPRGILAPSPDATDGLPITDSLVDFLRAELRIYKASVRARGGRHSDATLAMAIRDCPGVSQEVNFSPETLRRFLTNFDQAQGNEFIAAVAAFLLHQKWITEADIRAHDKDARLRAGVALQGFFGAVPHAKTLLFYRELAGRYVRYALLPGRIVKVLVNIGIHKDPPVLRFSEQEWHYRSSAVESILRETDNFHPDRQAKTTNFLRTHAELVGAPRYSLGFGIADASQISFFARTELSGRASILLIDRLRAFTEKGALTRFRFMRYDGWSMEETSGQQQEAETLPLSEMYRTTEQVVGPVRMFRDER